MMGVYGAMMTQSAKRHSPARGFTMVELLVVIIVIGILIGLLVTVSTHVLGQQKISLTQALETSLLATIDEFAAANPLRRTYDQSDVAKKTFGPYPPYQLAGYGASGDTVTNVLEPDPPDGSSTTLLKRLARDFLSDVDEHNDEDKLKISQDGNAAAHNANRALFAYLTTYARDSLSAFPPANIRPLPVEDPDDFPEGEFINTGDERDSANRTPVLGFYDAWGVPFEYLLYVKIELKPTGSGAGQWVVTDRRPVLMSRGVKPEQIANGNAPADKWIWSSELPSPQAKVDEDGELPSSPEPTDGGWVRAVPEHVTDIGYLPQWDGTGDE